jgi:hypothetical protein
MKPKKPDWQLAAVLAAILCTLIPFAAAAQEPAPDAGDGPPQLRTVIKQTRYVDVHELERILGMLELQIRLKPDINAIVLRGRSQSEIDTALRLIEALDVPPEPGHTVEVSAYVIEAAKEAGGNVGISENLAAAVEQLQKLFGYQSFKLLDTVFLRVLDGRKGSVQGGLALGGDEQHTKAYQLALDRVTIIPRGDDGRLVRLDGLTFELEGGGQAQRVYFRTDVEVREGQKAVVGKSTPRGTDGTLVLIVEARVVD